jgi:hypothetical protein
MYILCANVSVEVKIRQCHMIEYFLNSILRVYKEIERE